MKSVSKFKQLNHDALEAMKNWKEAEKKAKESATAIAKEKKEKKEPSKALRNEFEKLKLDSLQFLFLLLLYYFLPQLGHAASENKLEVAKFLIDKGANIYANNTCGQEPMHLAAYAGHVNIIDLFLSKGVSIENTDKNGLTPLHYAARFDHLDLTKFLLNKGANIHAKTIKGQKSIHLAARGGYKTANTANIVKCFLSNIRDITNRL